MPSLASSPRRNLLKSVCLPAISSLLTYLHCVSSPHPEPGRGKFIKITRLGAEDAGAKGHDRLLQCYRNGATYDVQSPNKQVSRMHNHYGLHALMPR